MNTGIHKDRCCRSTILVKGSIQTFGIVESIILMPKYGEVGIHTRGQVVTYIREQNKCSQ